MNRSLPPPEIPGLTYQGKLGAGGYADVYLYAQHMPARKVAVKVMREAGLTGSAVARFTAEANAMAQLEHPHIVPVYAAGVTPDGRPYLVMMYYPRASLSERVRGSGPLPVPEVLRIGIQIGSAVETAHRAGLLHRDIKPANVLTSQYDTPGLTDFGIAAQIAEVDDEDTGVSVPWSPPEVLYATAPATARSDVYSLAATLWHLLVGRSPFEVPGGENATFAMMKRIRDFPAPATGRPGVPVSLDRLLRSAMAKDPAARPASALDLVRSLQSVEQELRFPRTPIVVADTAGPRDSDQRPATSDATRVRAAQVVAPQPSYPAVGGVPNSVRSAAPEAGTDPRTVLRTAAPAAAGEIAGPPGAQQTRVRAGRAGEPGPEPAEPGERRIAWPLVALAAAVTVGVVVTGFVLASSQQRAAEDGTGARPLQTPQLGGVALPPGPLSFHDETRGDQVVFNWDGYPHQLADDTFSWRIDGETGSAEITEPTVAVPAGTGPVCIQVRINRADGTFPNAGFATGCQR